MKKLLLWFVAACMIPGLQAATTYEEGEHYQVIAEVGTSKPEVKEFFSYYCPACNALDPVVQSVVKTLPEGTSFKKYHVDFMGAATPEIQTGLTLAMAVAKTQHKATELNNAFFKHIHVDRKTFANAGDIRSLALSQGIDAAVYDKNIKNIVVQSQVKLIQKEQNELSKARILTSVPTFIVNGRYKIDISKLDRANQEQDLKALVHYLLQKK